MDVLGKKDFYKYIYEQLRLQPDVDTRETTDGYYQLNFVKLACVSAQLDLTEFFEAWGFLTPINRPLTDYNTAQFTITQQQIDQVKAEIVSENYPKPEHCNIFAIKDDNISDYR
jgi:cobalamin-dependent methionine synthase I